MSSSISGFEMSPDFRAEPTWDEIGIGASHTPTHATVMIRRSWRDKSGRFHTWPNTKFKMPAWLYGVSRGRGHEVDVAELLLATGQPLLPVVRSERVDTELGPPWGWLATLTVDPGPLSHVTLERRSLRPAAVDGELQHELEHLREARCRRC